VPGSPLRTASSNDNKHLALCAWWSAKPIAGIIAECYLGRDAAPGTAPDVSPRCFHLSSAFEGAFLAYGCSTATSIHKDSPQAVMRTALTPNAKQIKRAALGPVGGAAIKAVG
jgi:hypothetical protein